MEEARRTIPKGSQTVPATVPVKGAAARPVLKAGIAAKAATVRRRLEERLRVLRYKVDDDPGCGYGPRLDVAEADLKAGHMDQCAAELGAVERGLVERAGYLAETATSIAETATLARGRGEGVEKRASGGLDLTDRDGLMWLLRKRKILVAHYDAGIKFRDDYQLAAGPGMVSCLAERSGGGGQGYGASAAMISARGRVKDALSSLGTPELKPYIERVAAEGQMLSEAFAAGDRFKVRDHLIPVRVALDLLARHYGMIR